MQNIVQLKTQLAEAARLAKSKIPGHVRLAAILMDNFVEIQLVDLMKEKFFWNNFARKYSHEKQKNILPHHDALPKACVEEQIITPPDQRPIAFCHVIRNHLYHQGSENESLAKVALSVLHALIVKY